MPVRRYWKLTGFEVPGNGALELSELRLYAGSILCDGAVNPVATIAPTIGALSLLKDGMSDIAVTWDKPSRSAPGFALVWDFGASPVDLSNVRLGSASSADTFPIKISTMHSNDGLSWALARTDYAILYPGNFLLTVEPDPASASASVVCTWNPDDKNPGAVLSDGNLNWKGDLYQLARATVGHNTGKHYFEITSTHIFSPLIGVGLATTSLFAYLTGPGSVGSYYYYPPRGSVGFEVREIPYGVAANMPSDVIGVGVDSDLGTLTYFKNGVSLGVAFSGLSGTYFPMVGGDRPGATSDATANFGATPLAYLPTGYEPWGVVSTPFIPLSAITPVVMSKQDTPPLVYPGTVEAAPKTLIYSPVSSLAFLDAYFGGTGTITGTVKEKSMPTNVPLRRKVLLIEEASQLVIRQTWSDAITGNYAFNGIRMGIKYTVISYDHLQNFRAVIADNLTPEVMP